MRINKAFSFVRTTYPHQVASMFSWNAHDLAICLRSLYYLSFFLYTGYLSCVSPRVKKMPLRKFYTRNYRGLSSHSSYVM